MLEGRLPDPVFNDDKDVKYLEAMGNYDGPSFLYRANKREFAEPEWTVRFKQELADEYQRLRDCEEMEQFDEGMVSSIRERNCMRQSSDTLQWMGCCRLFGYDISVPNFNPPTTFNLPGLKLQLKDYQTYAVYWMLVSERSNRRGGFLCDEDGLGRQPELVAVFIIERHLAKLHRDVEEACNSNNAVIRARHLPRSAGAYKQPESAKCPSEANGTNSLSVVLVLRVDRRWSWFLYWDLRCCLLPNI